MRWHTPRIKRDILDSVVDETMGRFLDVVSADAIAGTPLAMIIRSPAGRWTSRSAGAATRRRSG